MNPKAHTRFVFPWAWHGEEVTIASRCTDERGSVQPTTAEYAKFAGVEEEAVKSGRFGSVSIIQAYKIDREGKVINALFTV